MSFAIKWILSVIISTIIDVKSDLNTYKNLADRGYKVNKEENHKKTSNNTINLNQVFKVIPFVNIGYSIFKLSYFNNNINFLIEEFESKNLITKMNKVEIYKYKKKPTALNAITISNSKNGIIPIGRIKHKESNGETSIIEYIMNDDKTQIEIISASGPVTELSYIEKVKYIGKYMGDEPRIIDNNDGTVYLENVEEEPDVIENKPLSKLERYKQLRYSLTQNGYLYGEEMWEYKELQEELKEHKLILK